MNQQLHGGVQLGVVSTSMYSREAVKPNNDYLTAVKTTFNLRLNNQTQKLG